MPGANPPSPGLAGVSIDGTGAFTFDRTKFLAAFDADPQGVTKLFAQGGTADNGGVQFVSAGDRAVAGTYDVNVTAVRDAGHRRRPHGSVPARDAADREGARGHDRGVVRGEGRRQPRRRRQPGSTPRSRAPGSAAGDEHRKRRPDHDQPVRRARRASTSTGATAAATSRTPEPTSQGTINGVAATGSGQQLMVPFSDNTLSGLALEDHDQHHRRPRERSPTRPASPSGCRSAITERDGSPLRLHHGVGGRPQRPHHLHQQPDRVDGAPRDRVRDQPASAVRDAREHDLDPEVPEQLPHEPDQLAQRQQQLEQSSG